MTLSVQVQLMIAVAAAGEQGGGARELCSPVPCGNTNISFPFGIIPEQAMKTSCGRPGFQVRCANSTPYLGYFRREHWFRIRDIFYNNASLLVADVHKLQGLNVSVSGSEAEGLCHVPTNNTPAHLGLPFSISPANHNLIFYNCTKAPAAAVVAGEGLVETRCGNSTFARMGGRYDNESTSSYGGYFLEGCDAAVVPVLGTSGSGRTGASRYEELIGDGFLLTWQLPPLSPSAG
jgi:hypothetical protein